MRVLIDACLPVQLKAHLHLPEVQTARELGWQHKKNGELLAAAQGKFDVLLTMDRSLPLQQHVAKYGVALIVIRAHSNRLAALLPLVPKVIALLKRAQPGAVLVAES